MGDSSQDSSSLPSSHPLSKLISSNQSCKFLRYHWVDFAGILRVFVVPIPHAINLLKTGTVVQTGLVAANQPVSGDLPMYILPYIGGKNELHPDWSSLRVCEYAPGNAMVMCFLNETHPTKPHKYMMGFEHDPRSMLSKALKEAEQHKLTFLIGFELEFALLEQTLETCALPRSAGAYSMQALRHKYLPMLEEAVLAIQSAGIDVRQLHAEYSHSQFEITTGPLPPMQAVDALVYAQEAIKSTAFKHGVHASFHPKPILKGEIENGLHMHFSVESSNKGFAPDKFLAGVLKHLRAMCLIIMPNIDSYERVNDVLSEKPAWVAWGTDNKAAAIRQNRPGYWESRKPDACANPYLSVAAHLVEGMSGLASDEDLAIKDCQLVVGKETDEELAKYGITERLPESMREAIQAFKDDAVFREKFGDAFVDRLAVQRTWEESSLRKMTDKDRRLLLVATF